jgi:hypothetical protein
MIATLERLRIDCQLDEALARGPDPLYLAAAFGPDEKTAIRYADAARACLRRPPSSTCRRFTANPRVHTRPRTRSTLGFPLRSLQFG